MWWPFIKIDTVPYLFIDLDDNDITHWLETCELPILMIADDNNCVHRVWVIVRMK